MRCSAGIRRFDIVSTVLRPGGATVNNASEASAALRPGRRQCSGQSNEKFEWPVTPLRSHWIFSEADI